MLNYSFIPQSFGYFSAILKVGHFLALLIAFRSPTGQIQGQNQCHSDHRADARSRCVAAEPQRRPILLHGAKPGLVDELIGRRCRSLRGRVEIGFDFRGGDSKLMPVDWPSCCEDLVLRMMTRTQTFPASMPSMGNYGKTNSKEVPKPP
jgi:hypothetical protein